MRGLILTLALLFFLFPFAGVNAQGELKLDSVTVEIWPEYDQPAVLTVYGFVLNSSTALPASLTVHIPSNAQINAVAIVDSEKGLVNAPYTSSIEGPWNVLKITVSSLQVQIEYYAPLEKNGTTRNIDFEWYGDYSVNQLDVNFLEPYGADNVLLSVSATDINPGQDGLTNYHIHQSNLTAGSSFSLSIKYSRNTDDLSISSLPVQAASAPGPDTPGRVSMTGVLPWILAGLGMLLIAAGVIGFIVWQRGSQGPLDKKRHRPHPIEGGDDSVYCHQCGKRAQPGDIFCRTCGTRLIKE